tara:strand:+ start:676 stop:864 length:189 start_codon:yes stop_codon:yes gene_type:complete
MIALPHRTGFSPVISCIKVAIVRQSSRFCAGLTASIKAVTFDFVGCVLGHNNQIYPKLLFFA